MIKNISSSQKKQVFTTADKINYWKQWEASGISKKKFCAQHRLPSSFYSWGTLHEKLPDKALSSSCNAANNGEKPALLPVQFPSTNHLPHNSSTIKCLYRVNSGTQLEFNMPIAEMVNFIQELSNAAAIIR